MQLAGGNSFAYFDSRNTTEGKHFLWELLVKFQKQVGSGKV